MIRGAETKGTYFTAVQVKPGDILLLSVFAKVRSGAPRAAVPGRGILEKGELKVQWRDRENKWVYAATPNVPLPRDTGGAWVSVGLMFIVPDGVTTALPFLIGRRMEPDDVVYFDDCSLKRLRTK